MHHASVPPTSRQKARFCIRITLRESRQTLNSRLKRQTGTDPCGNLDQCLESEFRVTSRVSVGRDWGRTGG
jgi:hypothetical protein